MACEMDLLIVVVLSLEGGGFLSGRWRVRGKYSLIRQIETTKLTSTNFSIARDYASSTESHCSSSVVQQWYRSVVEAVAALVV